jgi:hypothetical protein
MWREKIVGVDGDESMVGEMPPRKKQKINPCLREGERNEVARSLAKHIIQLACIKSSDIRDFVEPSGLPHPYKIM